MTAKLSKAAESALLSAHPRQGAVPTLIGAGHEEVTYELARAGLVGRKGGLTPKGVTVREGIVNARMEEAF